MSFEMSIPMVSFVIFACPMIVVEDSSANLYPFGPQAKTVADHTLKRSLTTKPVTIRPPPQHAINGVAC